MPCCDSEFVCEAPVGEARVYNDKVVTVYIEYRDECDRCGTSENEGSTEIQAKFKHGCQKRRKLPKDELHFSINHVSDPEVISEPGYRDCGKFKVGVMVHCKGCYEDFKVVLESELSTD
jgi:hypothetical protein